jgi:hypothetical protein
MVTASKHVCNLHVLATVQLTKGVASFDAWHAELPELIRARYEDVTVL